MLVRAARPARGAQAVCTYPMSTRHVFYRIRVFALPSDDIIWLRREVCLPPRRRQADSNRARSNRRAHWVRQESRRDWGMFQLGATKESSEPATALLPISRGRCTRQRGVSGNLPRQLAMANVRTVIWRKCFFSKERPFIISALSIYS